MSMEGTHPDSATSATPSKPGNVYRARDLILLPSLLSLARIPLAAAFALFSSHTTVGILILITSGVTDVLDGFFARRLHQTTPIGAIVDGVSDKVFVTTVIATVALQGKLVFAPIAPPVGVLVAGALLFARELGELPLVLWFALSSKKKLGRPDNWAANAAGKIATLLQFVAIGTAMLGWRYTDVLLVVTAVSGAFTAALYWQRTISTVRAASRKPSA